MTLTQFLSMLGLGAVSAAISYLLGSLNFAIIITYLFKKVDIRDSGSGNAGMTNVLRTVGVFPAILTLIGDFLKAIAAMAISSFLFSFLPWAEAPVIAKYLAGIFALIGHIYPLYFKFKGGKGVLTCAGIFFVLNWKLCLICIAIFALISFTTGYVSLGSIISMAIAPILVLINGFFFESDIPLYATLWQSAFTLCIALVSITKHKQNIIRLLNGTENCFKKKKDK
ncbi:MAG: glycerol-3-phosphate 1-O-acyltransferase PlsY [Oscillospiraceae bacterium]|nr:glycerol-3-phosphate 1-O-acyltransferase PlsY [Oscillospiraceae bacterium]